MPPLFRPRENRYTLFSPLAMPNPAPDLPSTGSFRFGVFELEPKARELRKAGIRLRLQPQPFQILMLLVERAGQIVTREELTQKLWSSETYVEYDRSLNRAVVKLRDVLGDSAESPRFIETLPKTGYRFIAPVTGSSPVVAVEKEQPRPRASNPARWLFSVVVLAVVMAYVAVKIFRHPPLAPAIHSIAVLPLSNLSGDASQDYFADGMTEELISDLSQVSALRVISRTSVMQYKNTTKSLRDIGRELNVDAIVEGSVERSGGRVRINAQLIYAPTDTHLWAKRYQRDLGDVLALQDDVAGAIAREIRIKLTASEQTRLASSHPINPQAHENYLKGLFHIRKRTETDLVKSIAYFQQAIEIDPSYAMAYAGLADAYALQGSLLYMVFPPKEAMPKSKAAAIRALQLDDSLGEAYATLAYIETLYDWDWQKSENDFIRAIELNPNYAQAHAWYAMHLMAMGKHQEAIAEVTRARELDPLSLIINTSEGLMYYFAGRYDNAIQQFQNTLELDPDFFVARWELGMAYQQKQNYDQAASEFQKARKLSPGNTSILESLAEAYALSGKKKEALRILDQLDRLSKREFVSPYIFAELNVALENTDQAFKRLETAFDQRDNNLIFLNVDPSLQTIRSDPRFQELLRRVGLSNN